MTRNDLCNIIYHYGMDYSRYVLEVALVNPTSFIPPKPPLNPCGLIFAAFEQQICANCIKQLNQECDVFDIGYSTEADFGCNRFESCE